MDIENENVPKLSVNKYTIDLDAGGCKLYRLHDEGHKTFICGEISDPQIAMEIIEGLIMVQYKRFYHPDSQPTFEQKEDASKAPVIPFLQNIKGEAS